MQESHLKCDTTDLKIPFRMKIPCYYILASPHVLPITPKAYISFFHHVFVQMKSFEDPYYPLSLFSPAVILCEFTHVEFFY